MLLGQENICQTKNLILNENPDIMADIPDNPCDDDSEEEERIEFQDHQSDSEE